MGCIPSPGIHPAGIDPHLSCLLHQSSLLCCSSLCQGRAQVGGTGHFLQAHKPEIHLFNYFQILLVQIKKEWRRTFWREAEANCRLAPGPHSGWRRSSVRILCLPCQTDFSLGRGWLLPCGCAHSFHSSARFQECRIHNQSPSLTQRLQIPIRQRGILSDLIFKSVYGPVLSLTLPYQPI